MTAADDPAAPICVSLITDRFGYGAVNGGVGEDLFTPLRML
jgi:hypothetical protein